MTSLENLTDLGIEPRILKWAPATPTKIRTPSDLDQGPIYVSSMDAPSAAQRKKIHEYFCRNILLRT